MSENALMGMVEHDGNLKRPSVPQVGVDVIVEQPKEIRPSKLYKQVVKIFLIDFPNGVRASFPRLVSIKDVSVARYLDGIAMALGRHAESAHQLDTQ